MGTTTGERTYHLKALTNLWTGDAKGNESRLITTGLLGSIRWWFEVVVRGLGGEACDPTTTNCQGSKHCVVCELFGCTGWARKFRFTVLDAVGNGQEAQIKGETEFSLRFTPLRPIDEQEWALLHITLRLIDEYGALGGKTVFKPTDEVHRANAKHHQDHGLVELVGPKDIPCDETKLKEYVTGSTWLKCSQDGFAWASLQHFWCVKGKYLARQNSDRSSFNRVIGREEPKRQGQRLVNSNNRTDRWLAGSQQESKKVFSFKEPARTFGFVKPQLIDFNAMRERLPKDWVVLEGHEIMKLLFSKKGEPA